LFGTPEEVAKQAVENDVHIVGISSLAGGHKTLIPKLINSINAYGENKIMIVVGGIIPKKDYNFLYKSGVSQIFGPGTIVSQAALEVLKKLTDGIN
jgi:methylmalonyl-CoA mutase